jgi:putative aminophosphonate oxidoreductase
MRPFWLQQALEKEGTTSLSLNGETTADVCIVGGGFTGLWTAIHLKRTRPELDIAIVEADICGAGASGRNGGCILSWAAKFFTLRRLFGEDEAIRLVQASEGAVAAIEAFCNEYHIDAEFRRDGTLYTATNEAQVGSTDAVIAALEERGICSFERLSPAQVADRAGSSKHLAGVYSPNAATVQPALLVRGLRRVAIAMGVRVYENTPMRRVIESKPPAVETASGVVRARKVVVAINAWMARQFPEFERTIAIVSSDMIITEPQPDLLREIGLTSGVAVLDSRTFVHYYRTTRDGRLMLGKGGNTFSFGGRILPVFDAPSPYASMLTKCMREFFPSLAHVPIAASWNGPSDRSVTGLPFFGMLRGRRDILYGLGYSGNGVGPSYLGGRILASLALDADDEWTRSPLVRGPLGQFPPEPIRYLGSIMVRNAIRRKERAEDLNRRPWLVDAMLSRLADAAGKADKM